jgi:acetolactate synthase-1/2/3 large subunit
LPAAPAPAPEAIDAALSLINNAKRPLILAGGGARRASEALTLFAERLQAPVALTTNARGLLAPEHPLLLDGVQSSAHGRDLFAEADVVLAVGTELGETDYDFFGLGPLAFKAPLIRLDIDPMQVLGVQPATVGLLGDAGQGLRALLARLPQRSSDPAWAAERVTRINAVEHAGWTPKQSRMQALLDTVRDHLPQPLIIGDSTQPVYQGALGYRAPTPNSWFNAGSGYGTLGYGLPAAIGAKLALPRRPVVALVGDGGLQFSSAELIAAKEAGAGVILLLWNNSSYAEIRDYMNAREVPLLGVDILTPDFAALAKSCHITHYRAGNLDRLRELLGQLGDTDEPVMIEVDAATFLAD